MCRDDRPSRRHIRTERPSERSRSRRRRQSHRIPESYFNEPYAAPLTTGRPDVDEILHEWRNRYSSYITASIFITTFNVNGRAPSLQGIPGWLTRDGIIPPDFYVIGLQEMDHSAQAFVMNTSTRHTEWKLVIARSFPDDAVYDLVHEVRLVGILLAVYRRVGSKIKLRTTEIETAVVPTGRQYPVTAVMGDKGAVAISLHMNDRAVCFVNAHFAAHLEKNQKRIEDYRHIVKSMRFPESGRTIFDHDAVFWFGDLNFRLEMGFGFSNEELRKLCSDENAFRDMIVYDQLKRSMKLKLIFHDFNEPDVLDFFPTFKYDLNSNTWDSSSKQRVPAWCDRILWWTKKHIRIRQKFYDSVQSIRFSDHRPVRSLFYMSVRKIDVAEYDRAFHMAIKEADRRRSMLNENVEGSEQRFE